MDVCIPDNIFKTSYRSLKGVGFIINCILFLCKFHIHKCKFTKVKPIL